MKKYRFLILLSVVGFFFVIPFVLYIIRFGGNDFSNNPNDWNSFFSFYIPILSLVVTLFLAYWVNEMNSQNARTPLRFEAYKDFLHGLNINKKLFYEEGLSQREVGFSIDSFITDFDNHFIFLFDVDTIKSKEIVNKIHRLLVDMENNEVGCTLLFNQLEEYKNLITKSLSSRQIKTNE
ncbi:MAG: hypothetical protein ABSF81_00835 [Bacteroidales bacterium]